LPREFPNALLAPHQWQIHAACFNWRCWQRTAYKRELGEVIEHRRQPVVDGIDAAARAGQHAHPGAAVPEGQVQIGLVDAERGQLLVGVADCERVGLRELRDRSASAVTRFQQEAVARAVCAAE